MCDDCQVEHHDFDIHYKDLSTEMSSTYELVTVGFLYRAGAETQIFVTGTSEKIRKFSSPSRKAKISCGYPENQEK